MKDKFDIKGRTALVTGAASGIGRGIALALAKRGGNLILTDLNEIGLAETAALTRPFGARTVCHRLDVGDKEAVAAFPDKIKSDVPRLDVLVNNAGVALGGSFEQISEANFEWLFEINFWGVVRMTRAFLPMLRLSDDARIVNLSSLYGIIAPPGQTAYCASKFAVRGFSEVLRHELQASGSTIGVTTIHPGGIATNIALNARTPQSWTDKDRQRQSERTKKALTMPPEQAGEIIVTGVENRQARVLVGNDAKFAALLERFMPTSYMNLLRKMTS
jgi:NAD(P)-dependent dehydrogenase (short-subunit alcohol dehydrogenase family)